ncbi:hypothetical protein D3C75_135750 [compost metagenome]
MIWTILAILIVTILIQPADIVHKAPKRPVRSHIMLPAPNTYRGPRKAPGQNRMEWQIWCENNDRLFNRGA